MGRVGTSLVGMCLAFNRGSTSTRIPRVCDAIRHARFFEFFDNGDVYHDAQGAILLGDETAKERALEIMRKIVTGPLRPGYRHVVCTVRDVTSTQIMKITIEFGSQP